MRLDEQFLQLCLMRDLIMPVDEAHNDDVRWKMSGAGLAYYRRLMAMSEPFREQHQTIVKKKLVTERTTKEVLYNESEAPLSWLRRRKGTNGVPFISDIQYRAGDKLRRDFTIAQLTPRVTTDWASIRQGAAGRRRDPAEISDHAIAARERVNLALKAVGPGLSEIAVSVCCHLEGLEVAERRLGWPKRAAKLVLRMALDRLAIHYGFVPPDQPAALSRIERASA